MAFAAPLALILLVPWLAAALWVLLATREAAYVPFVSLWPKSPVTHSARRSPQRPPLWVIGLLAAALLTILAAAGLSIRGGGRRLTVIVNCGLSMSPNGRVEAAAAALHLTAADTLHVIPVPGEAFDTAGPLDASRFHFAAIDTAQQLDRATRAALADVANSRTTNRDTGPVVLLTDHPPAVRDDRLIWLPPAKPLNDAGIDYLAVTARADRSLDALVRVYNGGVAASAKLTFETETRAIDLPAAGTTRDYFFHSTSTGPSARAELQLDDDIAADNVAYVQRESSRPTIQATQLPAALGRMIAVYTLQRPPTDEGGALTVSAAQPPPNTSAVWLAETGANVAMDMGALQIKPHPITAAVDWPTLARDARGRPAPGGDWQVLVGTPTAAMVAVRNTPQRQVWVGFNIDDFSNRPDYVIFWTNVLDWAGGGAAAFAFERPSTGVIADHAVRKDSRLDASPGIYTKADGSRYAVTAEVPRGGATGTGESNNSPPIGRVAPAYRLLAAPLAAVALALLALSLAQRRRLDLKRG